MKLSEKQKAQLQSEGWSNEEIENYEKTGSTTTINLDTSKTEERFGELLAEKKIAEQELEDVKLEKAEAEFDRQLKEAKEKARAYGIDLGDIETPDALEYVKAQIAQKEAEKGLYPSTPAGTAPLSPEQYGEDVKQGFDSYKDMFEYLHRLERSDNPTEAKYGKETLNKLWSKALEGEFRESLKRTRISEQLPTPSEIMAEMNAEYRDRFKKKKREG